MYVWPPCTDAALRQQIHKHLGDAANLPARTLLKSLCLLRQPWKQGSHLLVRTEVARTDDGLLFIPMAGTQIALPSLSITESSEGLLGRQKPPLQLVFRAMDEHGHRMKAIPPLLSDEFVVTTIRSSGKKPDIPLMTDPVSKIQAIGKDTVAKLKNLTAAAAASPDTGDSDILQDFCIQCNSITTVQEFQAMTHWCSQDLDRTKAVQRALRILRVPKGWQTATAHAKTAVAEDNQPKCSQMVLDWHCSGLSLALLGECSQQDLEQLQAMQQQAAVQWRSPGHIGWSIVSQPLSIPTPQLLPESATHEATNSTKSVPVSCTSSDRRLQSNNLSLQSGLTDNTSRASLPKSAKSAGIGESVQPSAAQGGFSPQGFYQFHTASHLMSPRRSDSEVQSPDFATLLGLVSPEDTPALQPTPGSLNLHSQADSVLPNLQGLSQLPSQVPNSVSGSLQYYCNDMPIPAFTQSQTPTHPSGQPVTENPSSDCVIRPPSTLSQQLSNSFPSIHPYFNSHHTSSAGHTQQLGSASPSFTDILNADCFPAWTAPANEPGSSP
ncbi:TPA: hypothetical protein ACH3X3_004529 [Trebouxia sp. C0006]